MKGGGKKKGIQHTRRLESEVQQYNIKSKCSNQSSLIQIKVLLLTLVSRSASMLLKQGHKSIQ